MKTASCHGVSGILQQHCVHWHALSGNFSKARLCMQISAAHICSSTYQGKRLLCHDQRKFCNKQGSIYYHAEASFVIHKPRDVLSTVSKYAGTQPMKHTHSALRRKYSVDNAAGYKAATKAKALVKTLIS